MIDNKIDISGQNRFIEDIGVGGEDIIFNHLKVAWNLY